MGKILEMIMARMKTVLIGALLMSLTACGNERDAGNSPMATMKAIMQSMKTGGTGAASPVTRASLAALKMPVMVAEVKALGGTYYMVPVARNGASQTWMTSDDYSVTLRDDVLSETRGFGPDLMQSQGPNRAQLARGVGNHERSYAYLDGGDRMRRFTYHCRLENRGAAQITVFGMAYATRHIAENCVGDQGRFANEYWFDHSGKIRKSKEFMVQGWEYMVLSRVID